MAASPIRYFWLGASALTLLLGAWAARDEMRVAAVAGVDGTDPAARDALLAEAGDWPQDAIPPRAALGLASLWLHRAAQAPSPRTALAAREEARDLLQVAARGRPQAAATLILRSQLALPPSGTPTPAALRAFAASYAAAPFLTAEGFWRAAFAARYWSSLPRGTQDAAVEEAVWLAGLDGRFHDRLIDIMGGSPMSVRFALRLDTPRH